MYLKTSAILLLFISIAALAQAPDGIPRDLARQRAQQLSDVRYRLSYTITPKSDFVAGREELRFIQNPDDRGILPEWLDFREGSIQSLIINGKGAPAGIQNGNINLPAKFLKWGKKVWKIISTPPAPREGKEITLFKK